MRGKVQGKTKINYQTKGNKILDLKEQLNSKINEYKNILHNIPSESFRNLKTKRSFLKSEEIERKKERTNIKCLKKSHFSVVTLEVEDNEGIHIISYSTMKKR